MGFDRAEFLDNLKTITGTATAAFPSMRAHFAALEDMAVNAVHVRAKEQEIEDLLKGMRDGGNVLSGGRQRRNGRNELSDMELLNSNDAYDNVLLQSTMDSLNDLCAIDEALAANWAERMELAEKYLDSEVLQLRPGETPEQYQQRITAALKEKQADMLPEDAARLDDNLAEENILKRNREAIVQELKERQNQYDIVSMLALQQQELATNLQNIDTRLDDNNRLRSRVSSLRGQNSVEAEAEIADILEERPDLEIDIPEGATAEERIKIVETALATQSANLEDIKASTEVELAEVMEAQEVLSVALPETKVAMDAARYNGEIHEEAANVTSLTGGFNFALNADEPLDGPKDGHQPTIQQENLTPDLGLKMDINS